MKMTSEKIPGRKFQGGVFLIIVAIILSLVMSSLIARAQSMPQVLLIPREGEPGNLDARLKKEVGVMTEMLQKAGFKVVVANVSGQPLEGIINKLKPDLKLADVKVDDYAGIIMPCMGVGIFPGPPVSPVAVSIVRQAVAKGKPVAAPLGSAYILAEAGVLKGKHYAFIDDPLIEIPRIRSKDSRFEGAIYGGAGVIQDGNIITSGVCPATEGWMGMPDRTRELTGKFISALRRKNGKSK